MSTGVRGSTEAARAALADTGVATAKVAAAVDTVFGLSQFEISGPMPATLGKSNNYPRSVMNRLGASTGCWRTPAARGWG
jgi:acetyl-CoA C-acetyltransferase